MKKVLLTLSLLLIGSSVLADDFGMTNLLTSPSNFWYPGNMYNTLYSNSRRNYRIPNYGHYNRPVIRSGYYNGGGVMFCVRYRNGLLCKPGPFF